MHRKTNVHIPVQSVLRRYDFCGVTSPALQSGEVEGVVDSGILHNHANFKSDAALDTFLLPSTAPSAFLDDFLTWNFSIVPLSCSRLSTVFFRYLEN